MIATLIDSNHSKDDEIEMLKKKVEEMNLFKAERDTALAEAERIKEESNAWEAKYQEELQRSKTIVEKAIDDWRASPAFLAAAGDYMSEHGDVLFIGGWRKCMEHTLAEYPDLDPIRLMDPQERARHERRLKKATAQSISIEELDPNDEALDFQSDNDADDDDDDGSDDDADATETSRALITQPEVLAAELPPASLS